jgi:hypothetical protein
VHVKASGGKLPENARAVFFHGRENPWDSKLQQNYKWIGEHYQ